MCSFVIYRPGLGYMWSVTAWMVLSDGKRLLLLDALTLKVIRPGQSEHILLTL